ncbi:MAG: hypothetical protein IJZ85_01165 [Lachnospiraceae bacterium]|nr:hypothetical protein [Lachnospiraceae bacterium]
MAKRSNVVSVKYSYVGTENEFSAFLYALVRDYLSVVYSAVNNNRDFVGKVETEKGGETE